MTRDELIEIATQVYGECEWHESALLHLEMFAQLVAAREREACAQICERIYKRMVPDAKQDEVGIEAQIIRARGNNDTR